MPAYSYVAVDAQGRTRRGVVEAEAPRQARAGLRSDGLVPLELAEVEPEAAAPGRAGWRGRRRRLSGGELVLVTRRLALLLEAGLTIEQCLDALIEQAQDEAGGRILAAVRAEVLSGHSLAAAFDRLSGVVSRHLPRAHRRGRAVGRSRGRHVAPRRLPGEPPGDVADAPASRCSIPRSWRRWRC